MIPDRQHDTRTPVQDAGFYAAGENAALAVEAERRRIAELLESSVVESLNQLILTAARYEQRMAANDEAQMAASVLGNLARGVLQQARDLQANLYPTTLESLGIEPALERLVEQVNRGTNVHVTLISERLRDRLPPPVELAIFRTAQEVLDYIACDTAPTRATLRLETFDDAVGFTFSTPYDDLDEDGFPGVFWRVELAGGRVEINPTGPDGFELRALFPMHGPVQLTERELQVLHLLGEGLTNKEIAERLVVSPRTVNFHLDNIYNKLGVNSRTEALVYAMRRNWIRHQPGHPV